MTTATPAFLRLTGPATTALFGLFALVHISVALYGLPEVKVPALALLALAAVLLAGYLVTLPREEPFPLRLTVAVVALTSLGSLNVWNFPDRGWPGWATWHWGAVTFVLFLLTLRGRAGWTWLGFGIMTALTVAWSTEVGRGAGAGIGFVIRSAALVLVMWLFSILLARTRTAIRRLQRIELGRVRAEAAAAAALEEQNSRLEQLRTLATPALERLLSAERITEEDRRSFALVEAGLRDQLRASTLATSRVTDAATRARARGIDVSLLDDRQGATVSDQTRERVEDAVVEHLDAATGGRVVARLLPEGRDSVATVLASDGDSTTRVAIPER